MYYRSEEVLMATFHKRLITVEEYDLIREMQILKARHKELLSNPASHWNDRKQDELQDDINNVVLRYMEA
jgi:hypothetical protein